MKTLINLQRWVVVAAIISTTLAAHSQDIVITSPSDDTSGQVIPYNAIAHQNFGTDFGSVNVSDGSKIVYFSVSNIDSDTALNVGAIQITGSNPGDFSIVSLGANNIPPRSNTALRVKFDPTDTGLRTATISIPSSDPDPGNPFLFNVSGMGVAGLPLATPKFWISDTGIKAKYNKKTGNADIKGQLLVVNDSNVPVGPASIQIYASSDQLLDDNDPVVGTVITPPITGYIDPAKPMKVKYKVSTDIYSGVLYFRILNGPGNLNDAFFGITP